MPTQSTPEQVSSNATGAHASMRRLTTARADARIALREINSAVQADKDTDREYYLGEAEARLALAIGAVRALRIAANVGE